jgi:DNA-binding transcriptional ArsR family regulator
MIGLIGPHDSVRRVEDVAQSSGMSAELLPRPYDGLSEVGRLTGEVASACRVILFTGLIPYSIARSEGVDATSIYIAHSAADLYAAVAHLLLDRSISTVDRMSIDVVDREVVNEVFDDLSAEQPAFLLEYSVDQPGPWIEDMVDWHARLYRSGRATFALTCLDAVSRGLSRSGIPHYRISHTRASVRDSLARAAYLESMQTAEDGQPAVAVLRYPDITSPVSLSAIGQRFADALTSVVFQVTDSNDVVVQTTRGAVEAYVKRMPAEPAHRDRTGPVVGFGFGKTITRAHAQAQVAVAFAQRNGVSYVVFEGGTPRLSPAPGTRVTGSQATALQARASELELSPLLLYRISNALKVINHTSFSADELATAYGGSPRTARRVIKRLREAGIVTQTGSVRSTGAGRPVALYAADIDRLLAAPDAEPPDGVSRQETGR